MSNLHKCPVCRGKGVVKSTFYPDVDFGKASFVDCRSCDGKGIIRDADTIEKTSSKIRKLTTCGSYLWN